MRGRIQIEGQQKQFEHQQQVLDCLTEAQHSLASSRYEKAKKAIEEGINLTYKRIKVITRVGQQERVWLVYSIRIFIGLFGVEFRGRKAHFSFREAG